MTTRRRRSMARNRNKKLTKLRQYRDKLLEIITNLEGTIRRYEELCRSARKALHQNDTLRAYALVAAADNDNGLNAATLEKQQIINELALVYRFLAVERNYTHAMHKAALHRDYLRVAALCADHKAEEAAHDKMLSRWSEEGHGFTRSLREQLHDEDAT
jgi:hypothetical protein